MGVPREIKEQVHERDDHRCQRCGEQKHDRNLNAHHIKPDSAGGETEPDNLITLCHDCHDRIHRYNEMMSDLPDRGLSALTLPDVFFKEYVGDLGEKLGDESVCIPVHIREAVYTVLTVEGDTVSQAVNFWRVDLQPEEDTPFGVCGCPSDGICRHLIEAHLVDPSDIKENGAWNMHAVDPGTGSCWAPVCLSDFLSEMPRYPELPFESRLSTVAEPYRFSE